MIIVWAVLVVYNRKVVVRVPLVLRKKVAPVVYNRKVVIGVPMVPHLKE